MRYLDPRETVESNQPIGAAGLMRGDIGLVSPQWTLRRFLLFFVDIKLKEINHHECCRRRVRWPGLMLELDGELRGEKVGEWATDLNFLSPRLFCHTLLPPLHHHNSFLCYLPQRRLIYINHVRR
jgi:hypothetical protein